MYDVVKIFNSVVREDVLSNPFEYMFQNEIIAILIFSLFGGKVLNDIAYIMCGVFYKSRSNKVVGSIGYMFFYCINVQVLIKLSQWFQNINLILLIYVVFLLVMFIGLNKIKSIISQYIV